MGGLGRQQAGSGSTWEAIGRQLGHPQGWGGRVVGRAMSIINCVPIRASVAALDVQPDEVALDLGCGSGSGVAALSRRARHVHGVDHSDTMLAASAKRNRAAIGRGTATIAKGDFANIPLPDDSVDKLLAANVAYFWDEPGPILDEMRRVVRPGGRVAVYVTDAREMEQWKFASSATHRHFTGAALIDLLTSGGFDRHALTVSQVSFAGVRGLLTTIKL
jgi:ubiquinone/menaquinone biosynthesis C-methylase UbiE